MHEIHGENIPWTRLSSGLMRFGRRKMAVEGKSLMLGCLLVFFVREKMTLLPPPFPFFTCVVAGSVNLLFSPRLHPCSHALVGVDSLGYTNDPCALGI